MFRPRTSSTYCAELTETDLQAHAMYLVGPKNTFKADLALAAKEKRAQAKVQAAQQRRELHSKAGQLPGRAEYGKQPGTLGSLGGGAATQRRPFFDINYPRRIPSKTSLAYAYGTYYFSFCHMPSHESLRRVCYRARMSAIFEHAYCTSDGRPGPHIHYLSFSHTLRFRQHPRQLFQYYPLLFTAPIVLTLQVYEIQHAQSVAHARALGVRHPSDPPEPPPPTPTPTPTLTTATATPATPSGTAQASAAASRTNTPPPALNAQTGNVEATTATDEPATVAQDANSDAATSTGQPTAEAEPNPVQPAQENVAYGPTSPTRTAVTAATAAEKDEIETPTAGAKRARERDDSMEESNAADPKRARTETSLVGNGATSQVTPHISIACYCKLLLYLSHTRNEISACMLHLMCNLYIFSHPCRTCPHQEMPHVQDQATEEPLTATDATEATSIPAPSVTPAPSEPTAVDEAMPDSAGPAAVKDTASSPAHDTPSADPETPEEPVAAKWEALTRGDDALSVGVQVVAALVIRNVARKGAHPTLLMPHLETLTEAVAAHLQHSKYIADALLALP